jgi:hypothetical protein
MLAVAHAGACPAVAEDPVYLVQRHDLPGYLGHELEVVRAQSARHPQFRHGPMPPLPALRVHRDPVGVRLIDILVRRVRVGAGDHHHVHLAAAGHQVAERVAIAEPLAAIVQRDLRRVVRHASAGAQARGIRLRALEVVEPEIQIVLARIVFHQRQLRPAHGPVEPAFRFRSGGASAPA